MALAVFGLVALPWVTGAQRDHDVSAASAGDAPSSHPEMPDVVELRCSLGGIDVPVASIRPQDDGMHLEVVNRLGMSTHVWVVGEQWSSGRFRVGTGTSTLVLATPPGPLTVGCDAGGSEQQRQVDLVDVDEVYTPPQLSCPEEEWAEMADGFTVSDDTRSMPTAARNALGVDRIGYTDQMLTYSGYPEAETKWSTPALDPVVRVVRSNETVALVHLAGTEPDADEADADDGAVEGAAAGTAPTVMGTPEPPWLSAPRVEYCPAFLEPPTASDAHGPQT